MNKAIKKSHRQILLAACLAIVAVAAFFFNLLNQEDIKLNYQENNQVDYKVYLKDNNYFDTPYLGMNKTYITNLIKYLDVNFHYNINFSEPLSGELRYYFKAIISADKANEQPGSYWSKEYVLSEPEVISISEQNQFGFSENLQAEYDKYNQIFTDFKEQYQLAADGKLKVVMVVEGSPTSDILSRPVPISTEISLTLPLSRIAIEASVDSTTNNHQGEIPLRDRSRQSRYLFISIACGIVAGLSLLLASSAALRIYRLRKAQPYRVTVDKILNDYDGIVINLDSYPKTNRQKLVDVQSFEELVDVYNSTRLPINFYESQKQSTFMILGEDMVWQYIIRRRDFSPNRQENSGDEA